MKRRPPAALSVAPEAHTVEEQKTMAMTAGGSLMLRDIRLNALGALSGITMEEVELGRELGRGASSIVYGGTLKPKRPEFQHLDNTPVAVKCLNNLHDKELRKQLLAELNFLRPMLQGDRCPYIVQLSDAYHLDDKTYVVMEWCERGSLDSCLEKYGIPAEPVLSVIMRHIFLGLAYLHKHSIIHRDMKPGNCLVTAEGVVKVSDFGSSKLVNQADGVAPPSPMATTFTGTMRYMSPERLNGEACSGAADVWCAGMIMLECAYGDHPYKIFGTDSSFMAMREYAAERETPPMPAGYSDEARHLVNISLAKSAADRPAAAAVANEAAAASSHPFIAAHAHLTNEAVAQWAHG